MHTQSFPVDARVNNPDALRKEPVRGQVIRTKCHGYLFRQGETPSAIHMIVEGWACRYRLLPDGRRQITFVYLPSDFCELGWAIRTEAPQPVVAITPVKSVRVTRRRLENIAAEKCISISDLWAEAVASLDIQAEWLLNLGRKTALERLAHLFCELFSRLSASGRTDGDNCDMPLTQSELADICGMTPVHVNRTLQLMRSQGLLELEARRLRVPDFDRLARIGLFTQNYLGMSRSRIMTMLRQAALR